MPGLMPRRGFAILLLLPLVLVAEDVHPLVAGLTITTPAGWTAAQGEAGTLVLRAPTRAAPVGEDAAQAVLRALSLPTIAVAIDGDARTADAKAVMDASLTKLARLVPDFALIEPAVEVVLHGRRWQRARYHFATGEVVWDQILLAGADPSGGICITCSTTAEAADQWAELFATALATVGRQASRLTP